MIIYPPRPTNIVTSDYLHNYDNNLSFIAQIKLNGSCCVVNKLGYNRHGGRLQGFNLQLNLDAILVGEYMNKSKKDNLDKVFNNVLVLHDILSIEGRNLVGKTYSERYNILCDLVGKKDRYNNLPILYTNKPDVFLFENMTGKFTEYFNEYSKVDMIEGLVIKQINSTLKFFNKENNNSGWQFKVRKPTKNYTC